MYKPDVTVRGAVAILTREISLSKRNLAMPGDPNYQPSDLKPYLGFDQWTGWLIIVEWFWMYALTMAGVMPLRDAKYLTRERLFRLLQSIPNTRARELERKKTKHDILALLELMRLYLPRALHRWLHYCATSYDIINTAYALMNKFTFRDVFWKKHCEVDEQWQAKIAEHAYTLQPGRTHLQTALPITVGFWLAGLHDRFVGNSRKAKKLSGKIPGKFTGAVGTSASQMVLIGHAETEKIVLDLLELPRAKITTQVTAPEPNARFYIELDLISGALANFTDDVRILQSSQYGELASESSPSSTMAHKKANPIVAENVAGMHVSVIAESMKVLLTLISNLQRDLRWSNVMRSYSAAMVFLYQQLENTLRILKTMRVDEKRCRDNFDREANLVVGELLHLYLQENGYRDSHQLVNTVIVPRATASGRNLAQEMDTHCASEEDFGLQEIWQQVPAHIMRNLVHPEDYIGKAADLALQESKNALRKAG